jgi:proteic killer suppression protein
MIVSFADAATADLYGGRFVKPRFPIAVVRAARRKLSHLHAASSLDELGRIPGNRLERLSGGLVGFHSIRVNDQWRITFRWTRDGASDVRLTDYHS